jgi:hypothetical protein
MTIYLACALIAAGLGGGIAASVASVVAPPGGFAVGSFTGQHLLRHLPVRLLRIVVAVAGLGLAVKLGAGVYG